jgi:hypothetical protein
VRFEITHRFDATSVVTVESLYLFDDAFNEAAFEKIHYGRTLLEKSREGDVLQRRIRITPRGVIPSPFSALISADSLSIVESTVYDLARHRGTWELVPNILRGEFHSAGTIVIAREGDRVRVTLDGETRVSVPFIGGRAAKTAVAMARASHDALAEAVRVRLAETPGPV